MTRAASTPAGEPERYDRVLATLPSDVFAQLAGHMLPPEYRLDTIEYFSALCLLLELDRPFSPYYWTNVADRELPFVGLIEHTNFVEPERYDGRRFLYVANYLQRGHELLELDAAQLLERYTPGLRKVNPGVRPRLGARVVAVPGARRAADRHRRLPSTASRRCAPRCPG